MSRVRLTAQQQVEIVEAYQVHLTPVAKLAEQYGVTRMGIYKVLKREGVNTTKRKLLTSCAHCGAPLRRTKAKVRRQQSHFCNRDCYYASL
jgi:recombinational DNA repair protein (RecF pathway)